MTASYEPVVIESIAQWPLAAKQPRDQPRDLAGDLEEGHGPLLADDDIVDPAICFGRVDSQPRSLDEHRSQRLLTPRRAGSSWSKVNKEWVRRLQAAGQMTAAIGAAKPDRKQAHHADRGRSRRRPARQSVAAPKDINGILTP